MLIENKISELKCNKIDRRVSKELLSELVEFKIVFGNLSVLPKCRMIVKTKCESCFDFRIRRMGDYLKSVLTGGRKITRNFLDEKFKISRYHLSSAQTASLELFFIEHNL